MNFVEKFDGFSPGLDAHVGGHVHVDSVSTHAPPGAIVVNDAQLLFTGDLKRSGLDLVLSKDDRELVLQDYFKGEKRAALASPDGAHLTGDIVNALTGYTQYAQAGAVEPPKVIGHVSKLAGSATAVRNGVAIVLNQGDNVLKGDVVQAGADSSLGITFIDGTVFGLGPNAKMVLNEMVYDPNGSNNSSLMSLVQGTISFVAGATAKHGDMKVDTPVATMGIRGTAVLVEIDFTVPAQGGAPPASFQVLVEPDGTTGSYILFDKTTLNPIATVDQAGTQTVVNGQGSVSFLASAPLSADAQKLIADVFALKFTDNSNTNTKLTTNFTDSVIPETTNFKLASTDIVVPATIFLANIASHPAAGPTNAFGHVALAPTVLVTQGTSFDERLDLSHSQSADTVSGVIRWVDINVGDRPSASASFTSFNYYDAANVDVTSSLTAKQLAAIKAVEIPLQIEQTPGNLNVGSATWTYSLPDGAFDFLAAGETLRLTYTVAVDNNFAPSEQVSYQTFTITVTGTNDVPVITSAPQQAAITEIPAVRNSPFLDTASGTITFTDPDLTDTHSVTVVALTESGVTTGLADEATVLSWLTFGSLIDSTDGAAGSRSWFFSAADKAFDYLAAGETLTLTYLVQVDDQHGGVVTQPITITITGTNDTPVITSPKQAAAITEIPGVTGSITPDTASGLVTFTDVDLSDTHHVTVAGVGEIGVTTGLPDHATVLSWLSLGKLTDSTDGVTGADHWTFAAPDKSFDYLAAGETLTLTYLIQVDDHHGGVVTQPVTITITGTNDVPIITSPTQAAAITEIPGVTGSATPDTAHGAITFTDPDLSDTHSVTITGVTETGITTGLDLDAVQSWLTLGSLKDSTGGATGSDAWTFSAPDKSFDYLAAGQTLTLTYNLQVDDHHGGVVNEPVTITIDGSNDAPVFTSAPLAATITEAPDTTNSNTPHVEFGGITFTDPDLSDTHSVTITGVTETGVTSGLDLDAVQGWVTLDQFTDSTGGVTGWQSGTFSAPDKSFDYLAAGETLTLTYTVQVDDHHGGVVTQPVTITIIGTNDAPVITSAPQTATIAEAPDTTNSSTPDIAAGAIAFTDPDLSDTHSVTITGVTESGVTSGLDLDAVQSWLTLGKLSDSTNGATGSDAWTFSAPDKSFDYLAAGETLTLTYNVQVDDHHGGVVNEPITITIDGTNDAPTLASVNAGTVVDTVAYDTFNPLTGTLHGNDVDHGETATLTYAALDANDIPTNAAITGLYGALTVNANGGYTYVPNAAEINALAAGNHTDTFKVETIDVHGATGTATLTVDVTGADDAPVINADNLSVSENAGGATIAGLTVTDADATADESFTLTAHTAGSGTSSVIPGAETGHLTDINATLASGIAYDEGAAPPATDMVTVSVADGHGASDTVNLIFNVQQNPTQPVTLTGTSDKDVFFASGYQDKFVFAPNFNHDTILNFTPGQDQIDLSAVVSTSDFSSWFNQNVTTSSSNSADTLITVDAADTITLHNVSKASLTQHDFILHFA
ncbi:VCBS domain-containing protein [Bradyrhizobium jicamae]|uniref:VCBS domain-containing protein n=1 Tax=Bradyrhizobium jicamae TaxID=280332 RepID=UPI001BA61908|nr:VCBS domain-containing protein [Bradyrhizobium jicamae]MBR0934092.1 VCBS domain-containing protein [Bradyrhizobium jicamae]